jgi:cytochrome c-type biogenesis protein CcmE
MTEKRRNQLIAVGALVVAGVAFLAIAIGGIGENLVYYWGPSELRQAGRKAVGATIRLGGLVREGSIRGGSGSQLEFEVTDGKEVVPVRATSIPPQMFREGIGVVVEGTMSRDGVFVSDRLMVSHGNEYRAPKAGEKVDAKELIESTEGLSQ